MGGTLHDAIHAENIARTFEATPEQLLERVRKFTARALTDPPLLRNYRVEDMFMRKLAAVLLIVVAFASYADKQKASKSKDKRFEAIAVQASSVTGSYRGPAESYGLVLELAQNGTLRGNYVEMGRVAVLNNIALNGSEFTARASFDDGSSRTITGSFANRVSERNDARSACGCAKCRSKDSA